jgi:hypothetical protein
MSITSVRSRPVFHRSTHSPGREISPGFRMKNGLVSPSTSSASTTMTPAFAEYRQTLDGAALMPSHAKARRRCSCRSVPRVLPGRQIQRAPRLRGTIFARVEEWYRLPTHARRGVGAAGAGDPADHHPGAGLAMNENPLQGSFAVDEPTDQLGGMDTSGITRSER